MNIKIIKLQLLMLIIVFGFTVTSEISNAAISPEYATCGDSSDCCVEVGQYVWPYLGETCCAGTPYLPTGLVGQEECTTLPMIMISELRYHPIKYSSIIVIVIGVIWLARKI